MGTAAAAAVLTSERDPSSDHGPGAAAPQGPPGHPPLYQRQAPAPQGSAGQRPRRPAQPRLDVALPEALLQALLEEKIWEGQESCSNLGSGTRTARDWNNALETGGLCLKPRPAFPNNQHGSLSCCSEGGWSWGGILRAGTERQRLSLPWDCEVKALGSSRTPG